MREYQPCVPPPRSRSSWNPALGGKKDLKAGIDEMVAGINKLIAG
ncbi:hypothetical protein [Kribbella sp. NPDC048915]